MGEDIRKINIKQADAYLEMIRRPEGVNRTEELVYE